jgi:hypothetical protein
VVGARFACPEVEWSLTLSNGSSVLLRHLFGEGWTRVRTTRVTAWVNANHDHLRLWYVFGEKRR